MTRLKEAEYAGTGAYHQREGYWEMLAPWAMMKPQPGEADDAATEFASNLQKTRERLDEIFSLWGQLTEHYQCADAELVATAMNDQVGPSLALAQAGQIVMAAHTSYSAAIDGSTVQQAKSDNLSWAPGFVERWKQMEADFALDDEEFVQKYGQEKVDYQWTLQAERGQYTEAAENAVEEVKTARSAYHSAVGGIDLEELSELRFEMRNEAVDVADDVDELTEWIMQSEAFADLGLNEQQARSIAEQVFQQGGWAGQYTDAEGRTWVRAADGRMVRAGSMMDPALAEAIIQAMTEDDEVGVIEIEVPSQDGQKVLSIAISELYGNRSDAVQDWLATNRPDMDPTRTSRGFVALGVFISLLQGAHNANSQRDLESQLYPLLNEQELDERRDRNLGKEGINTVAGTVVTIVSGALAPPTGGGSVIIGAIVNVATGEIIGWLVETVDESLTTASQEEVDEMSDEEFAS